MTRAPLLTLAGPLLRALVDGPGFYAGPDPSTGEPGASVLKH